MNFCYTVKVYQTRSKRNLCGQDVCVYVMQMLCRLYRNSGRTYTVTKFGIQLCHYLKMCTSCFWGRYFCTGGANYLKIPCSLRKLSILGQKGKQFLLGYNLNRLYNILSWIVTFKSYIMIAASNFKQFKQIVCKLAR